MSAPTTTVRLRRFNLTRYWRLEYSGHTYLVGKRRSRRKVKGSLAFADSAGANNGTLLLHEAVKAVDALGLRRKIRSSSHLPIFTRQKRPFRTDELIPFKRT